MPRLVMIFGSSSYDTGSHDDESRSSGGIGISDDDLIIRSYGSMPYPGSSSRDYPHVREGGGDTPPFKGLNTKGVMP